MLFQDDEGAAIFIVEDLVSLKATNDVRGALVAEIFVKKVKIQIG